MSIIETRDLTKRYGKARGIQNVNLRCERGEIFGFLGPNGAGKTTTIRLLLDLINPTSGQVLLFGRPVERQSVELHNETGYLPGELRLYERMTGRQFLDYLGRFQHDKLPARQRELLDALDLSPDRLNLPMRFFGGLPSDLREYVYSSFVAHNKDVVPAVQPKIDNTEAFVRKIVRNVEPRPWPAMSRRMDEMLQELRTENARD